jgi:hypothetical protein
MFFHFFLKFTPLKLPSIFKNTKNAIFCVFFREKIQFFHIFEGQKSQKSKNSRPRFFKIQKFVKIWRKNVWFLRF